MPKPPNKAPIANLTGPSKALVGEPVTFDGSGSSDPDTGGGQVKSWAFDPGIGESGKSRGNGQPSIFTLPAGYQTAAPYDAVLSVFDKPNQKGSTNSCTLTVTVADGPPVPVDCVLSPWRLDAAGEWTDCQPDSTQSREEYWVRDILTPPANGGIACGPTKETRLATQPCTWVPPAEPVDCVLGPWRLGTADPWDDCQPNGTQTRDEIWVRDVVTPPANGGAECGPTSETRQGTQSCTYVPPPTGSHPYWDRLTALSQCAYKRSLRSQAELDSLVAKPPSGKFFPDPLGTMIRQGYAYNAARDAAELIVQVGNAGLGDDQTSISIPTTQQLRMSLGDLFREGALLCTWDHQWDANVRTNYGGTTAYKSFKFQIGGDHPWWTMLDNFGSAPGTGDPSCVSTLQDEGGAGMGGEPDPNVSNGVNFPLCPAGTIHIEGMNPAGAGTPSQRPFGAPKGIRTYYGPWMRYWVVIEPPMGPENFAEWNAAYGVTVQPNPADPAGEGRWYRVSKWVGDAAHGIRRVIYKWPCQANMAAWGALGPGRFDVEMNTSKRNPLGPISAATRNVVMLKDYPLPARPEDDTQIFDLTGL